MAGDDRNPTSAAAADPKGPSRDANSKKKKDEKKDEDLVTNP